MIRTFSAFEDDNPRDSGEPHDHYNARIRREYREYAIESLRGKLLNRILQETEFKETVLEILSTIYH